MKTPLFMLTVAVLSLTAAAVQAAPSEVQAFLDRAQAQAEGRLATAKVDLGDRAVQVRGALSSDGRLTGVHVIGGSGSRDLDLQVERALDRLQLAGAPPMLGGSTLTLSLHRPSLAPVQAD